MQQSCIMSYVKNSSSTTLAPYKRDVQPLQHSHIDFLPWILLLEHDPPGRGIPHLISSNDDAITISPQKENVRGRIGLAKEPDGSIYLDTTCKDSLTNPRMPNS